MTRGAHGWETQVMDSNSGPEWTWSEEWKDYYYVRPGPNGQPQWIFSKQTQQPQQQQQQHEQRPQYSAPQNSQTNPGFGSDYRSQPRQHGNQYPQTQNQPSGYHQQLYHQQQSQNSLQPQWSYPFYNVQQNPPIQQYSPPINQYSHGVPGHQNPTGGYHSRRNDSVALPNDYDMPPPVPHELRAQIGPRLIPGTPHRGWADELDPNYKMRSGKEAHHFFKIGRVFALLWAETASATMASRATDVSDVTVDRFPKDILPGKYANEWVYSQIRRFVIVDVVRNRNFVKACPIYTYSKRGTTKRGCDPSEHAVAYFSGTEPYYIPGEYGNGMTKAPIEIKPSEEATAAGLEPESRIRFGRTHPIEWNVKVKDIGQVRHDQISQLIQYWREENRTSEADNWPPGK